MIHSMLLQIYNNGHIVGKTAEEFGTKDPSGMTMIVIAFTVVLFAFIALYLTFKGISKIYKIDLKNRFKRSRPDLDDHPEIEQIPGETIAAIALTLHLYHEKLHGLEDAVITFKNAAKTYSPWSSKIYGLRKAPKN